MSKDIRTEEERKDTERDALIAGLSTEVSRVYEKLDKCEDRLATVLLALKQLQWEQRRLAKTVTEHFTPRQTED